MTVNYSEYNKIHYPRAEALVSFMKCLHHAMQKTDDYAGAMHQLKCIGYSDEFIAAISEIAEDYIRSDFYDIRTKNYSASQ